MLRVSLLERAQQPTLNRAETPVRHAAHDQHQYDRAVGEDEKAISANDREVRSACVARRRSAKKLARTLSEVVSVEVWLISGDNDSHREVALASSPAGCMDQDRV